MATTLFHILSSTAEKAIVCARFRNFSSASYVCCLRLRDKRPVQLHYMINYALIKRHSSCLSPPETSPAPSRLHNLTKLLATDESLLHSTAVGGHLCRDVSRAKTTDSLAWNELNTEGLSLEFQFSISSLLRGH